ncbi:LysR family transcriptional regulator [Rhodobacter sp. NTK016B]|uniref:LysR family transcriptional regulator n=1 Tax=Rhodobacter sp. NTK016B TaxID=2759676 RepID=UPI001A8E4BD0|nr:LysR family transcriptional regulator [Rhodobacter sp. NTK016B]MBN8291184.1 LysR family transcriptional regulator [Rhodobacter sp. NTK016B]
MRSIRLEALDLNLLKLFVAVADTGSVSHAAVRVGLTQPSASNALSRLRHALDDPLFLRERSGMVPTRYAAAVLPTVRKALDGVIEALAEASHFDPAQSRRSFRLSLSGLGEALFLPQLTRALFDEAPHIRLQNDPVPLTALPDALHHGQIDLALGLLALDGPDIGVMALHAEEYVAISGPDAAPLPDTAEALRASRLVIAAPATTYAAEVTAILSRHGLGGNVALYLREFTALPELLHDNRFLAIVPSGYARMLARAGRARILPGSLGSSGSPVTMVWSRRAETDPGFRWFRDRVGACLRTTPPVG